MLSSESDVIKFKSLDVENSLYLNFERDEESDLLWIVFSHIKIPAGKFGQARIFRAVDGNVLYVNCANNSWYQSGTGGELNTLQRLIESLVEFAGQFKRVRVAGHSMGGYPALILQHLNIAEFSFVSSPEPVLRLAESRSERHGVDCFQNWGDLAKKFDSSAKPGPGLTLYGVYDHVDAYFIHHAYENQHLYDQIYTVPSQHGVLLYLIALDEYKPLLEDQASTTARLLAADQIGTLDRFGTKEQFLDQYNLAACISESPFEEKRALENIERNKDWDNPGYKLAAAKVFRALGKRDVEFQIIESIASTPTTFNAACIYYARLLKKRNELDKLNAFVKKIPDYPLMLNAKAKIIAVAE